jgi:polyisoprenoid-binding protein YceI
VSSAARRARHLTQDEHKEHMMSAAAAAVAGYEQLTGDYVLDPAHTRLGFVARHAMITRVRGQFTRFDGHLTIDGREPANSRAEVTIETASVESREPSRDAHLRSSDFFDVEAYPQMTFVTTAIEQLDQDTFRVTGDLTIKSMTRPITFDLTYTGAAIDDEGDFRIGFEGATTIARKDWGLTWNFALEAGGVLVSEKVTIELDVAAVRAG